VILVDGSPYQLKIINKIMKRLNVKATIVMDFIHVLEYLWKAAWCFFEERDSAVEEWVADRALKYCMASVIKSLKAYVLVQREES
jgi:hypothetical protein